MAAPNGIGPSVLRALLGTALEAKWTPDLQVSVDGQPLQGVSALSVKTRDENGNSDATVVIFSFIGSGTGAQRTASISRKANPIAANTTGDGFTATLQAL